MRKLRRVDHDDNGGRRRFWTAIVTGIVLAATVAVRNQQRFDGSLLFLEVQPQGGVTTDRSLSLRQETPAEPVRSKPQKPQITVQHVQEQQHELPQTIPNSTLKEASRKSLHPKWKLWHEMNPQQQEAALQEIAPYMRKYGQMVERRNFKLQIPPDEVCELYVPGSEHRLCGPAPPKPCTFLSFGINDDPSYDIKLAEEWGCRGFAADPTIVHPSKLHPLVTFHNLGLTTLRANEEKLVRPDEDWWYTSMPALRKFLQLDHVDIMKIDCEGCEVALARDILAEDPTFFQHISQMTIETHVTKAWIENKEELYYFGLLFPLLEEAGFVMVTSMVFGCNIKHERYGCMPEFGEWGFPCGLGPHRKVAKSCHDFLFVKKEKAYRAGKLPS